MKNGFSATLENPPVPSQARAKGVSLRETPFFKSPPKYVFFASKKAIFSCKTLRVSMRGGTGGASPTAPTLAGNQRPALPGKRRHRTETPHPYPTPPPPPPTRRAPAAATEGGQVSLRRLQPHRMLHRCRVAPGAGVVLLLPYGLKSIQCSLTVERTAPRWRSLGP
jgi:hypothetical protein